MIINTIYNKIWLEDNTELLCGHATLEKLGLLLNTKYGYLICKLCGYGLHKTWATPVGEE